MSRGKLGQRDSRQDILLTRPFLHSFLANKRAELMLPIFEKRRAIIAKIPKFWSVVCQNHEALSIVLSAEDIPVRYFTVCS